MFVIQLRRLGSTVGVHKIVAAFLVFGLCCGCSTGGSDKAVAARLGYEGCRVSKSLTIAQVMAKDMGGNYQSSRPHPDWDALIAKYASGDKVYFIDCTGTNPSRIFVGTSQYALVRDGVVIARAAETIYD
jgi:cytochrome oxidase Cu insertion factor (SCO1/SenC/PrrC family)